MFYFSKKKSYQTYEFVFCTFWCFNNLLRQNIIYFLNNNMLMGLSGFSKISLKILKIPINIIQETKFSKILQNNSLVGKICM